MAAFLPLDAGTGLTGKYLLNNLYNEIKVLALPNSSNKTGLLSFVNFLIFLIKMKTEHINHKTVQSSKT